MDYKIGNLNLKNKLVLAPMAGITDLPFRMLCKKYGAGLVYSEMISSEAIVRNNKATKTKMIFCKKEKPISAQIFGAEKESIIKAAKIVEKQGADIIDFNIGCPDPAVIKQGAGAAFLKDSKKISEIVSLLVKNIKVPVTVKMRSGINNTKDFLKIAKAIEKAGASAIAVHPRTVKQRYCGKADWSIIKEIKNNLNIPVIGSGDVCSGESAKQMLAQTKCDFVMIGRAAIGNPYIFREIDYFLKGKKAKKQTDEQKLNLFFEYVKLAKKYKCYDFVSAKTRAMEFTKGIKHSASLRQELSQAKTLESIEKLLK